MACLPACLPTLPHTHTHTHTNTRHHTPRHPGAMCGAEKTSRSGRCGGPSLADDPRGTGAPPVCGPSLVETTALCPPARSPACLLASPLAGPPVLPAPPPFPSRLFHLLSPLTLPAQPASMNYQSASRFPTDTALPVQLAGAAWLHAAQRALPPALAQHAVCATPRVYPTARRPPFPASLLRTLHKPTNQPPCRARDSRRPGMHTALAARTEQTPILSAASLCPHPTPTPTPASTAGMTFTL